MAGKTAVVVRVAAHRELAGRDINHFHDEWKVISNKREIKRHILKFAPLGYCRENIGGFPVIAIRKKKITRNYQAYLLLHDCPSLSPRSIHFTSRRTYHQGRISYFYSITYSRLVNNPTGKA